MLSPRTERASKLIPPDEFSALVQPEGLPISGAEFTCAATAVLGKAATKTSADAQDRRRDLGEEEVQVQVEGLERRQRADGHEAAQGGVRRPLGLVRAETTRALRLARPRPARTRAHS